MEAVRIMKQIEITNIEKAEYQMRYGVYGDTTIMKRMMKLI